MVNSNQKGKRGEREACEYLRKLGYTAKRTQQFRGDSGDADIEIEELPRLHVEVKYGYPLAQMNVGTAGLAEACEQAYEDSGSSRPFHRWIVLWRNYNSKIWKLTFPITFPGLEPGSVVQPDCTIAGDEAISAFLRMESAQDMPDGMDALAEEGGAQP